jgi:hypothetical protein
MREGQGSSSASTSLSTTFSPPSIQQPTTNLIKIQHPELQPQQQIIHLPQHPLPQQILMQQVTAQQPPVQQQQPIFPQQPVVEQPQLSLSYQQQQSVVEATTAVADFQDTPHLQHPAAADFQTTAQSSQNWIQNEQSIENVIEEDIAPSDTHELTEHSISQSLDPESYDNILTTKLSNIQPINDCVDNVIEDDNNEQLSSQAEEMTPEEHFIQSEQKDIDAFNLDFDSVRSHETLSHCTMKSDDSNEYNNDNDLEQANNVDDDMDNFPIVDDNDNSEEVDYEEIESKIKDSLRTPTRAGLPGMIVPTGLMSLSSAANIFRPESLSSKNSSRCS